MSLFKDHGKAFCFMLFHEKGICTKLLMVDKADTLANALAVQCELWLCISSERRGPVVNLLWGAVAERLPWLLYQTPVGCRVTPTLLPQITGRERRERRRRLSSLLQNRSLSVLSSNELLNQEEKGCRLLTASLVASQCSRSTLAHSFPYI